MSNQPSNYNHTAIKNENLKANLYTFKTHGVFHMGPCLGRNLD